MRILHICLSGQFSDGLHYQENLITKYQSRMGHQVTLVTSKWQWNCNGKLEQTNKSDYINDDNVHIIRLDMKGKENINNRLKRYKDVYITIEKNNPDIIFIHGCQFLDIRKVVKYARNHNVKIYVDNHADFRNSAKNWISRYILHGVIWKYYANLIEPYTEKFYGVLPARVDFLEKIYKLPKEKVELLVMGADDELVENLCNNENRTQIRNLLNLNNDDFVIITGGKIDIAKKQVLLLLEAVKKLDKENLKIIIFGSVAEEIKNELISYCDNKKIIYVGWLNNEDTYRYISASDVAVYPASHSVLWEQTAGMGIPIIVKYFDGATHIDVGGNAIFIREDSVEEIEKAILFACNKENYVNMKSAAEKFGIKRFSYKEIAKKAIE